MQPFEFGQQRRRSPFAAAILGLLTPGLGLLYCGRLRAAFVALGAAILPWLICAVVSNPTLKIAMIILHFLIYAVQLIWGVVVAWRIGENYTLQRFNRGLIYVLLFMFFAAYNEMDSAYLTQMAPVATESMSPTLHKDDLVVVSKIAYSLGSPQRGDAVVYRHSEKSRMPFLGRVLALPGDEVSLENGHYTVNGQHEGRTLEINPVLIQTATTMTNMPTATLADDQYFIAADNMAGGYDSRFFGNVDGGLIMGRVDAVMLSKQTGGPEWARKP